MEELKIKFSKRQEAINNGLVCDRTLYKETVNRHVLSHNWLTFDNAFESFGFPWKTDEQESHQLNEVNSKDDSGQRRPLETRQKGIEDK